MQRPLIPPPFDDAAAEYAIAVGVASVYAEPDSASEVVTQALLGTPLIQQDTITGWRAVQLPDYTGWIPETALASRPLAREQVAVVTALRAPLFTAFTGDAPAAEVYATTALPFFAASAHGARVAVTLPGGRRGLLNATDCIVRPAAEPFPARPIAEMLAFGRTLLGVPYLWGGGTILGLDCSGLAQLCYRYAGVPLLRDADQQYASIPYIVERYDDLRAGDLAFFARGGRIVHVGVMLDASHVLHADGTVRHQVTINSFSRPDADTADFSARLAALFAGARRPLPQAEAQ